MRGIEINKLVKGATGDEDGTFRKIQTKRIIADDAIYYARLTAFTKLTISYVEGFHLCRWNLKEKETYLYV